jgi:hypothetical protein
MSGRDPNILKIEPSYHERERKYVARKKGNLSAILKHVRNANDEFVTYDHPDFIPDGIPKKVRKKILMPREITVVRERIYFLDTELKALFNEVEIRQEAKAKYPVKQTIKTGHKGSDSDHTLDRWEHPAKLRQFGPLIEAVDDAAVKKHLQEIFAEAAFVPALRMVSQRTRLSYHPEGNPDIAIEMAFDLILWGQTAFGFEWQEPKIEIELVKGASNAEEAQKILDKEEKRLLGSFPLKPVLHSNPTPGFEDIEKRLSGKNAKTNRQKFEKLQGKPFFWFPKP